MSKVDVSINEAVVTAVHEFNSIKGYGVDFFIEAQSSDCTLYLQVVLYDNEARRNSPYIHAGDRVKVAGTLKDKPYTKKDGTAGHSLLIERPTVFKIVGRNSVQQSQQQNYSNNVSAETNYQQTPNAASQAAATANSNGCAENTQGNEQPQYTGMCQKKTFTVDGKTFEYYDVSYDDDFETPY